MFRIFDQDRLNSLEHESVQSYHVLKIGQSRTVQELMFCHQSHYTVHLLTSPFIFSIPLTSTPPFFQKRPLNPLALSLSPFFVPFYTVSSSIVRILK